MRSAQQADSEMLRAFRIALQENGVQMTSFGIWFVSTVHNQRDIDQTLEAARNSLAQIAGRAR
jgi:glutamate-1-semialdehyde aminotransferase